ncbi:MAG: LytTR family transcriptional regulator DNA-binding domain-containing protein [Saprospiraceae bacterium]
MNFRVSLLILMLSFIGSFSMNASNLKLTNNAFTEVSIAKKTETKETRLFQNGQRNEYPSNRVSFSTRTGFVLVRKEEIISIGVNKLYGGVQLHYWKNNESVKENCNGSLSKIIENLGDEFPFVKVSRSAIVNLNEVRQYSRKRRDAYLTMSDGANVKVSRKMAVVLSDWFRSMDVGSCRLR